MNDIIEERAVNNEKVDTDLESRKNDIVNKLTGFEERKNKTLDKLKIK